MASRETSDGTRTIERLTNEGTPGYYAGNPLTKQRDLTTQEAADLAAIDAANAQAANAATLQQKAQAALTANANDITQNANIVTTANSVPSSGTFTTTQLSTYVRQLAQAVATLAGNDTNAKKELNAVIRLLLGALDDISNT